MSDEKDPAPNVRIDIAGSPGAIAAGRDVNISAAPQPQVLGGHVEFENRPWKDGPSGGEYHTRLRIRLQAAYAARGFRAVAQGSSLRRLDVSPNLPAAMVQQSAEETTPTRAGMTVFAPLADEYFVDVYTADVDQIHVEVGLTA